MKEIKTNNGKKGGWLVGKRHYDKDGKPLGGIKAIVTDAGGKPVELEGGEVIINREASKKYWKELSKINQSAGNGVAIGPPSGFDEDPEDNYENGGKIDFNPNHIPNKWILSYAEKIKANHPEIWKLGGNIFGNEAFKNLKRVAERGHWLDSEEWMYVKWRAYVARHQRDYRIEGVVAMLKWVDKVEKGWPYMKQLIEEKIKKIESKKKGWKHKMNDGGSVGGISLGQVNKISQDLNANTKSSTSNGLEIFVLNKYSDKQYLVLNYKGFAKYLIQEFFIGSSLNINIDWKSIISKIDVSLDDFEKLIKYTKWDDGSIKYTSSYKHEIEEKIYALSKLKEAILNNIQMKDGGPVDEFPNQIKGNDDITWVKTKQSKDLVNYTPYYRGYSIDTGGANFRTLKEANSYISTYILSNQWYNKLRYEPIKELPKMKEGGRTIAQTPAPKEDQIKGSNVNKPGSSASTKSASSIKFYEKTIESIKSKVKEHNQKHPDKKITLASAKAVVRRGMGAYSSTHRPTIGGGKPNDRTAWGLARLNAFTYKIVHGKSKSGKYTQDDDLINELGYSVSKYHLGGDMSKHLAPNGKPSNLNHDQWHLVRTPEFKAWFGDWENDPANASKVIDENGEPLVVYHGTYTEFNVFRYSNSIYFTSDKNVADKYAKFIQKGKQVTQPNENPVILSCFLNIRKLLVDKIYGALYEKEDEIIELVLLSQQKKYNGILLKDTEDFGGTYDQYIVFNSNQIKLADGTNTTFDSNNPDIRFNDGGKIKKENKHGDCYVVAGKIAMGSKKIDFIGTPYLVHAQVEGQGAIKGIKYGHAWVEDDIFVYDYSNGRELVVPKKLYYAMGNIKQIKPQYYKYTFNDAMTKMIETNHYGSWDLQTESGL